MKRVIAVLTTMLMIISIASVALAEELEHPIDDTITEAYETMQNYYASASLTGSTFNCSATVMSRSRANLSITLELQRYYSTGYATVTKWTNSGYGLTLTDSHTKTVNLQFTYRLKATLTAGPDSVTVFRPV